MSIAGNWTLFYSWGCSGTYSQTPLTINTTGKFTVQSYTGQWAQSGGNVQLVFEPTPEAVYSGNVSGSAMSGMMTNFHLGIQGCWHATLLKGAVEPSAEKAVPNAEHLDASGKKS